MKRSHKIVIKVFLISTATLLLLVGGLLLTIGSGALNGPIARIVSTKGSLFLNGKLTVGSIDGNLLNNFTVNQISVETDSGEVFNLKTLQIDYAPTLLLSKKLLVNKFIADGIYLHLAQHNDSLWNIEKLIPAYENRVQTSAKNDKMGWCIQLDSVLLLNVAASISTLDTASYVPRHIETNISLNARYTDDSLTVKVKEMDLLTVNPDLCLSSVSLGLNLSDTLLQWDNLKIKLKNTNFKSSGIMPFENQNRTQVKAQFHPLDFEDFRQFLKEIPLHGTPNIDIALVGAKDKNHMTAVVEKSAEQVKIDGWINIEGPEPEYHLSVDAKNFNGFSWTNIMDYQSDITGGITIVGKGRIPETMQMTVIGNLEKIKYQQYELKNLLFNLDKTEDTGTVNLSASAWFGQIATKIQLFNIFGRQNYTINGNVRHIDLASLTRKQGLSSSINLDITGHGEGFKLNQLRSSLRIRSNSSTIAGQPIDNFDTRLAYNQGSYVIDSLHIHSPFFKLDLNGKGNLRKQNVLLFDFETANINPLLYQLGYQNIAVAGKLKGNFAGTLTRFELKSNLELDSMQIKGLGTIRNSQMELTTRKFDSLRVRLDIAADRLMNDTLTAEKLNGNVRFTFTNHLEGQGLVNADALYIKQQLAGKLNSAMRISTEKEVEGKVDMLFDSLNYAGTKVERMSGTFSAISADSITTGRLNQSISRFLKSYKTDSLMGAWNKLAHDTIALKVKMEAINAGWNSYTTENLTANLTAKICDSIYSGDADIEAKKLMLSDVQARKAVIKSNFNPNQIKSHLEIEVNDSLSAKVISQLHMQANPELVIEDMKLATGHLEWQSDTVPARIKLYSDSILVSQFGLKASGNQFLDLGGRLAFKGEEDFHIAIKGVNLERINQIMALPYPINGIFNGRFQLSGNSVKPTLDGAATIASMRLDSAVIDSLHNRIFYDGKDLQIQSSININGNQPFRAELSLPVLLSFEESIQLPGKHEKVNGNFELNDFNLNMLKPLLPNTLTSGGMANSKLKIGGTLGAPLIDGNFSISKGYVKHTELGMDYRDIDLEAIMVADSLNISQFKTNAGSGSINLEGYLTFLPDSFFVPDQLSVELNGKDFKAFDSDMIEAIVNSELKINGSWPSPEFNGNLEVLRSKVNADAVMARFSNVSDIEEEPMLIQALSQSDGKVQMANPNKESTLIPIPDFLNLNGEFSIRIPGNCWVKGKSMNIELKGDLRAKVENNLLNLSGDMNVKRGYYEFLGKRFDFKSGTVTLTGGADLNPILDFDIYYAFRDIENELRKLELAITGRIDKPTIAFKIDDKSIDEKEALSWLLFGKSPEQLTEGQKSTTESTTGDLALNMAFGQLSEVLKKAMQDALGLDVVEISGNNGLNETSVTVGKYITNNIFISLEQTFSLDKKTKVLDPTKLTLEYQIIRGLFLKASDQGSESGIDLILKRDFK